MKQRAYFVGGFLILFVFYLSGCVGGGLGPANVKLDAQDYAAAIPLYKEFLAENPASTEARSRLGFAYLKTGRLDEAVAEFETVLNKEPGEPYSVLYLGLAYLNRGEIGRTIKTWHGYRNKNKPAVEAEIKRQITLLQIAESQRMAKKALADEKKLMTVEPKENTIAVSYFKDLSPDQSLAPFQKGLAAIVSTD
ncbi:MAG: tetratricopeptide repeat protein, partial [Deltaproteobacteria bacterium]|nr:tetratricopeptide repeat protein [Deltaproteobacteria bacterium]